MDQQLLWAILAAVPVVIALIHWYRHNAKRISTSPADAKAAATTQRRNDTDKSTDAGQQQRNARPKSAASNSSSSSSTVSKKLTAKQLKQQQQKQGSGSASNGSEANGGGASFPKSWLFVTAKGHSSQVCDAAFSASGQYLASCSEAGTTASNATTPPIDTNNTHTSSTSSSSNDSSPTGSPRQQNHMQQQQLSSSAARRQARKNTLRPSQASPVSSNNGTQRKNSSGSTSGSSSCGSGTPPLKTSNIVTSRTMMSQASRTSALTPPLKEHIKLNLPEAQLARILRDHYVLRESDMLNWGFPQYDAAAGGVVVYTEIWREGGVVAAPAPAPAPVAIIDVANITTTFDVNAREFVPGTSPSPPPPKAIIVNEDDGLSNERLHMHHHQRRDSTSISGDSGQGSGTASPHSAASTSASDSSSDDGSSSDGHSNSLDRTTAATVQRSIRQCLLSVRECGRCRQNFVYNDASGSDAFKLGTECYSHLGKPIRVTPPPRSGCASFMVYSCCQHSVEHPGCQYHRQHVWSGLRTGLNGPFQGYVETAEPETEAPDGNYGVFALDAEMVYTANGLELAKITVIGHDGRLVYEKYVRPSARVIDYNTRFSGITEKMLTGRGVRTLPQVQADLLRLFTARTIVVGHAINNDLRCLKMLHRTVVDTSVVFPHHNGQPYRLSLRTLVKSHLQRDIQQSEDGHCSFEDSRNCLAVLLWHVRRNHTRAAAKGDC